MLLRVERQAGHVGGDGTAALIEKVADMYAFALTEIHERGATMK